MITLDGSSAVPAYDQVREQVVGAIRVGNLLPGQRLPSIRQLAGDLGVAPGTVARAFTQLEAAGFIRTGRTGTFVTGGHATSEPVRTAVDRLVDASRSAGLTLDDAIAALRACW